MRMRVFILIFVTALLCSCSGKLEVPLLVSDNEGNVSQIIWDTQNNDLLDQGNDLFQLDDASTLKYANWDGSNRLVLYNSKLENSDMDTDFIITQMSNNVFYFEDTTLKHIEKGKYQLDINSTSYDIEINTGNLEIDGNKVDISKLAISSYMIKDEQAFLLFNTYSFEKDSIILLLAVVDFVDNSSNMSIIDNLPPLSPSNPPAGNNVITLNEGFIVFNSYEVSLIDIDTFNSTSIITTDKISFIEDKQAIVESIGYHSNILLIKAYQLDNLSDDKIYKLYAVKDSKVLSEIFVAEDICLPH